MYREYEYIEENEDQIAVFINDKTKEYMIIYTDFLNNGFENETFKFVSDKEFKSVIQNLENAKYKILPCQEDWYFEE